jgi:beta-lactamase superfamily II metal-dependent hydrolase
MAAMKLLTVLCALSLLSSGLTAAEKTLDIYFIDVEGGQATLIVTPEKQSILVDTGWPGFEDRDADRIAKTAKKAGLKKIDHLLITHYHRDHVGGISQLLQKMPVVNFLDHGPNRESGLPAEQLMNAYLKAAATGQRLSVKAGEKLPLKGAEAVVVSSDGELLAPAGTANPLCAGAVRKADDPTENARSLGFLLTFGKFTFLDLGDLTWNKELDLACPANRLGPISVYLTTHHGMDASGPRELVHALRPRVAIMNNGSKKGGSPSAWQIVRSSPGLEDLWQLHYAIAGGKDNNSPDAFLADTAEFGSGNYIKLSANKDGSFSVFNSRNKFTKTYAAR